MKTKLGLFLVFIILSIYSAFADINYYPKEMSDGIKTHHLKNEVLKKALFATISNNQTSLGYDGARKYLFGKFYLKNDGQGYYIKDVYCHKKFGANAGVGPNSIPKPDKINCEHTWPQSKFTRAFPKDLQKADLHHLYPSDSRANSIRGNMDFTDVADDNGDLSQDNCSPSKFGSSTLDNNDGFEPPLEHKGNVARSIFYFSVRYKLPIPKNEEEVLRHWDQIDPPDQEEMDRNEDILKLQGNKNPFIDFVGLANDIDKF